MIIKHKLVVASGNRGKLREINQMLAQYHVSAQPQSEFTASEAEETGLTFVENAILKARHACNASSLPAIGDDSGLVVTALGGAPGIYSARYAGPMATDPDNINKLLQELATLPDTERSAHFQCVMVYMRHADDPVPIIAEGRWHGQILSTPRGDNGFGYDPIFFAVEKNCSAAELDSDTKNTLSHRGQALRSLLEQMQTQQEIKLFPGER